MEQIVKAICISEKKGTAKHPIQTVKVIENYGFENDAHAGNWHRQVSLLSYEERENFKLKGSDVEDGAFGENLLISGIDFKNLPIGTLIYINDVVLKLTQIGKSCHSHCAIYHQVGDCIMPRCGVFSKVIHGGVITLNDKVRIEYPSNDILRVAILTASDKASRKERVDLSGPTIQKIMECEGYEVANLNVVSDDKKEIMAYLIDYCDRQKVDLVLTTGGTGLSPRDVTPEATLAVADRMVPGISEAIRYESMKFTPKAMLSRAVSVQRKQTLIINLPGSPKAVKESLDIILPVLKHALEIMKGQTGECARE